MRRYLPITVVVVLLAGCTPNPYFAQPTRSYPLDPGGAGTGPQSCSELVDRVARCGCTARNLERFVADANLDRASRADALLRAADEWECAGIVSNARRNRQLVANDPSAAPQTRAAAVAKLGPAPQPEADGSVGRVSRMPSRITDVPPPAPSTSAAVPNAGAPAWLRGSEAQASRPTRRLAVLEFRGPLEAGVLAILSDEARTAALEAVRPQGFAVMTRESMASMLKDMGRGAACTEGECEVETARNIGADLVISGEVVRVENTLMGTLKLHEVATGSLLASKRFTAASATELVERAHDAAADLFR